MDHTIVHFEIPADNIEELSKFYSNLFDWKIIHSPVEGMEYYLLPNSITLRVCYSQV